MAFLLRAVIPFVRQSRVPQVTFVFSHSSLTAESPLEERIEGIATLGGLGRWLVVGDVRVRRLGHRDKAAATGVPRESRRWASGS